MRLFAIGDIHGRSDLLRLLLKKLREEESLDLFKDKLIFLADYGDRGLDSKGVYEIVMDLDARHENVICLIGNHEEFLILAHEGNWLDLELWKHEKNGGQQTLDSFGGKIPEEVIKWIKSRPYFHKEKGFFFSHASAPRESRRASYLKKTPLTKEELIWTRPSNRDEFGISRDFKKDDGEDLIGICGHYKKSYEPRFYKHYYFIDTACGCSEKGRLTAVEVRSKKVIQAHPKELVKHKLT